MAFQLHALYHSSEVRYFPAFHPGMKARMVPEIASLMICGIVRKMGGKEAVVTTGRKPSPG